MYNDIYPGSRVFWVNNLNLNLVPLLTLTRVGQGSITLLNHEVDRVQESLNPSCNEEFHQLYGFY